MKSSDDSLEQEIEGALEGVHLQDLDLSDRDARPAAQDERLVPGVVVGVHGSDVFVELGPRNQGVAPLSEFDETPEVGTRYEFTLRGREDDLWKLSRREALQLASWRELEEGSIVKGLVKGQNTGGLELRIGPVTAFMPASHVDLGHVQDLSGYLGQTLLCQVLEIDRARKRIVVSRRAVLEREREAQRAEALEGLRAGEVVRGKVTRIEPYGAFVELAPGVEGLLHVSNLSRRRVQDPAEVLAPGETVEVLVLEITEGGKRIALGRKQLEPDPWDDLHERLAEDSIVSGQVTRIVEFGAFVEVEPGVEGLLHVSQLDRVRPRRVRDILAPGQEVTVRVVEVDAARRRLSLSRLDPHGAVLGSEEAADSEALGEVLRAAEERPRGQSLGDLLRKALDKDD